MRKLLLLGGLIGVCSLSTFAAPIVVACTVTSGSVLTSALGGVGYSIANGIGTSTGGATGSINCPAVSTASGTIFNYQVRGTIDYQGGPFGTTTGTSVLQTLTLVGGALNGASVAGTITGGNSSSGVVPPVPFQIGPTLSGATSYNAFTVNVASSVVAGGPVSGSSGQVVLSYDVIVSDIPEPSTYLMFSAGLIGLGLIGRRVRAK